jgi:hypothetical protein
LNPAAHPGQLAATTEKSYLLITIPVMEDPTVDFTGSPIPESKLRVLGRISVSAVKAFPIWAIVLCVLLLANIRKSEVPEATISNGIVTAKLLLPDAERGYYRGVRFDWSGVISDLTYKGHHYFGKWFDHYEPTLHDAIMGPVDAYDPIGYDLAKAGGRFVKIGVGTLEKIGEEPYAFVKPYRLLDGGKWQTKKTGKNSV